jgi:hypothetical protein
MYICQVTGKQSRQGDPRIGELYHLSETGNTIEDVRGSEKLNKIVVATRERVYTRWVKNEETHKYEEVEAGRGWEIVREINASDEGLALWNGWSEEERAVFLKHLDS